MKKAQHHPGFVQLIYVLKPLLRKHPPLALMHVDDMVDWMSWYWNRGTMAWWISDITKEPRGICLIRLFRTLEQFLDYDAHDPCGEFCFVELLIARDPIVANLLLEDLTDRWGEQKIVMWERGERTENGSPRMYTWKRFMKLSRRLLYGGVSYGRS